MIIKKNPDTHIYNMVAKAVNDNDGYCCCKIEHSPENKCICQDFKE